MITVVKRAPFVLFLCIGFALGDLVCIGYWNSVGIHLKFNMVSEQVPRENSCTR